MGTNMHARQARAIIEKVSLPAGHREAILLLAEGVQTLYDDLAELSTTLNERFDSVDSALKAILERVTTHGEG